MLDVSGNCLTRTQGPVCAMLNLTEPSFDICKCLIEMRSDKNGFVERATCKTVVRILRQITIQAEE